MFLKLRATIFTDTSALETYSKAGTGAHPYLHLVLHPLLLTYAKALQSHSVNVTACTWLSKMECFSGFARSQ